LDTPDEGDELEDTYADMIPKTEPCPCEDFRDHFIRLVSMAVIVQAVEDTRRAALRVEAQCWLQTDGKVWLEALGIERKGKSTKALRLIYNPVRQGRLGETE
jgi:hypothetical protein